METPTVPHDHDLAYGFPTVFGRGLLDGFIADLKSRLARAYAHRDR